MKTDETIKIQLESGIVLTATENSLIASRDGEEIYRIETIVKVKNAEVINRIVLPNGSIISDL